MTEAVIVALITAGATIVSQLIIANRNRKATSDEFTAQFRLLEYKVKELGEKQDKYNHLQERVYKLEEQTAVQTEQIKVANNRIADLERKD